MDDLTEKALKQIWAEDDDEAIRFLLDRYILFGNTKRHPGSEKARKTALISLRAARQGLRLYRRADEVGEVDTEAKGAANREPGKNDSVLDQLRAQELSKESVSATEVSPGQWQLTRRLQARLGPPRPPSPITTQEVLGTREALLYVACRSRIGITQTELAADCAHLTQASIAKYERGDIQPRKETVLSYAAGLEVDPKRLWALVETIRDGCPDSLRLSSNNGDAQVFNWLTDKNTKYAQISSSERLGSISQPTVEVAVGEEYTAVFSLEPTTRQEILKRTQLTPQQLETRLGLALSAALNVDSPTGKALDMYARASPDQASMITALAKSFLREERAQAHQRARSGRRRMGDASATDTPT